MANSEYTYINSFRIDILDFNLYKNEAGKYLTTCQYNEEDAVNKLTEPVIYKDFGELCYLFSNDLTQNQLKEKYSPAMMLQVPDSE